VNRKKSMRTLGMDCFQNGLAVNCVVLLRSPLREGRRRGWRIGWFVAHAPRLMSPLSRYKSVGGLQSSHLPPRPLPACMCLWDRRSSLLCDRLQISIILGRGYAITVEYELSISCAWFKGCSYIKLSTSLRALTRITC
jgi:hypothetical protein